MPNPVTPITPQHFVLALVEDFSHMAFSCAVDPLRIANLISEKEPYTWSFASLDGKTATSSNRSVTLTHTRFQDIPSCDRLFVLSGINMQRIDRTSHTKIGALCLGAYILVLAGFMNNRQTAIHWEYNDSFLEEFPEVNLVRDVFVADEKHGTASGCTATADLILNLLERDHGYDLSVAVADQMVYNAVRDATGPRPPSAAANQNVDC